jgi:transposase
MSEAKVHVSVEQRIIIKFLTKEGCKASEICSGLKKQYGEKTLSNVSVYKWSNAFKKKGGKQWRTNLMSAGRGLP